MKISKLAIALGIGLLTFGIDAQALNAYRTGPVTDVQLDSHVRAGYPDLVWVYLPGTWANVSCSADWAYFNAKEDSHLLGIVLMARATGAQLRIYVDDALPKVNGSCHVMTLYITGS